MEWAGFGASETGIETKLSVFRRHSLLGLCVLAVLATATFLLLEWGLTNNASDPIAINVAGQQRMLTQRLSFQSALLDRDLSLRERRAAEAELLNLVDQMKRGHHGLTEGDPSQELSGSLSDELRSLYFDTPTMLSADLGQLWEATEVLVATSESMGAVDELTLAGVLTRAERIMPKLERSVALFQAQANSHLASVERTLQILYGLMLLSVVGIWRRVFRPMMRMLRSEEEQLSAAQLEQIQRNSEQEFVRQLNDAMEMRDEEASLMALTTQAMDHLQWDSPIELLLSDSSKAHMRTGAAHATHGAPGCSVENPWQCVAVRRARPMVFRNARALDACPKLRERLDGPCSALCVPVTFMGESMGVLHTADTSGQEIPAAVLGRFEALASTLGARLGSVRSFQQVQLQATTDPLTGLLNRRALEDEVRKLVTREVQFAVCIADLDHFKKLNDTYGHDTGDRALGTFSKAVREVCRDSDLVARFGGEEFVVIFPNCTAENAMNTLERLRSHLATVTAGSDTPTFTASYGVSDTRCGTDLQALIKIADTALLRAKDDGRDRIIIADMGAPDAAPPPMQEVA